MNTRRLVVFLLAAGAAGVVALMARNLYNGGTKQAEAKVAPAPVEIAEVLVASQRLEPGQRITASQVHWQQWPVTRVDSSFIQKSAGLTPSAVVEGSVVRAPIVEGEPVTYTKIIKSEGAGFMAATLAPGMRAVSIPVSVASTAGGFIQPNDRVDLMLTVVIGDNPKRGLASIVVGNVRVLAIDQASENKNQKAVSDVKTVTLELTPDQARATTLSQALGTLSLALRSLGDDVKTADAESGKSRRSAESSGPVSVIRYGMERRGGGSPQ
jgi:pilus assembly protein CpaB